jgi:uncharacterized membrane protein SirB2
MYIGLLHTHRLVVILFLLIYVVKTVLLLFNKQDTLDLFTKKVKIPEMVISFLFLATGVALLFLIPEIKPLLIAKIVVVLVSIPVAVIGFKRKIKALGALSLLLIVGAYGMAEVSKRKITRQEVAQEGLLTDPAQTGYDQVAHGKVLYGLYCNSCHGEEGDLQMAGAKNLKVTAYTEAEVVQIVTQGKGEMMGYQKVLSAEEIAAVSVYALTLKKE